MNALVSGYEVQLGHLQYPVAVETCLEAAVMARQRRVGWRPRRLQRHLDVPAFARRGLIAERRLDRLRRAGLALLEAGERHLQRRSARGIFGAAKCRQMLSVVSTIIVPAGVAGHGSWLMCCLGDDMHTALCGVRRNLNLILGHLRVFY